MTRVPAREVERLARGLRIVAGNGGRASHSAMHHALKDGHHPVLWSVWPLMFPGHDGRSQCSPTLTEEQAIQAEQKQREEPRAAKSQST